MGGVTVIPGKANEGSVFVEEVIRAHGSLDSSNGYAS
jgi:hypothetical protein